MYAGRLRRFKSTLPSPSIHSREAQRPDLLQGSSVHVGLSAISSLQSTAWHAPLHGKARIYNTCLIRPHLLHAQPQAGQCDVASTSAAQQGIRLCGAAAGSRGGGRAWGALCDAVRHCDVSRL